MIDYLIVGAGLYGATCARLLADAGKRVLVIERRAELGGNCHDSMIDGVRVSTHGGHIFHTYHRPIWDFVNRFADWLPYTHRVMAYHQGKAYSLPPNLRTYEQLMIPSDDVQTIRSLFFEGYTAKQWGKPIDQVPTEVIQRIPIRDSYDDRYFTDPYQGLPRDGYTALITRMLDGIEVEHADYLTDELYWNERAREIIYTGALDEYYRYDAGRLAYRSLRFTTHRSAYNLPAATVNYSDPTVSYTRRIDWGWFWGNAADGHTIITTEYPAAEGEPYYPVNDAANNALHERYLRRSAQADWLHIGGRLGAYRYWNMDQAIGAAMALVERIGNK